MSGRNLDAKFYWVDDNNTTKPAHTKNKKNSKICEKFGR
jgi:hypothetical protein